MLNITLDNNRPIQVNRDNLKLLGIVEFEQIRHGVKSVL